MKRIRWGKCAVFAVFLSIPLLCGFQSGVIGGFLPSSADDGSTFTAARNILVVPGAVASSSIAATNGSGICFSSGVNGSCFDNLRHGGATSVVYMGNNSLWAYQLTATSAITGPVPVKADTANANKIVQTVTTDTGAGIPIGVVVNSPGAGGTGFVVTDGVVALTLGTGTCSIGNFVIVDTTTNGRVKCTATYTAGTVIGVAMAANSTVGTTFNVMVGLR